MVSCNAHTISVKDRHSRFSMIGTTYTTYKCLLGGPRRQSMVSLLRRASGLGALLQLTRPSESVQVVVTARVLAANVGVGDRALTGELGQGRLHRGTILFLIQLQGGECNLLFLPRTLR
eukprot:NODE_14796_length_437_cov_82.608280_g14496_i0.p1 GENE.NODE_14796_length_437_cov_82.608280_g14496_i0~~NODE_14796_length_437_cov_82.608280_g14496_i0.p1  ORF type:complete len:119 (-),score=0.29 NODE_14796_length_437_cov_82.608280_g14496_i0:5-361(-)